MANTLKHGFKDTYYVAAYEYALQGMSDNAIGKTLGIPPKVWKKWLGSNPALRKAIQKARSPATLTRVDENSVVTRQNGERYLDYCYRRLPENLQALWRKIEKYSDDEADQPPPDAVLSELDRLFTKAGGKRARQHLFLHAMVASNFNASEACRKVGISHSVVDKWDDEEPEFRELYHVHMKRMMKDFAEGALFRSIAAGEAACIIFANKTLNADRGYNPARTVKVEGGVLHASTDLSDVLDGLPADQQRVILDAIRRKKDAERLPPIEVKAIAS